MITDRERMKQYLATVWRPDNGPGSVVWHYGKIGADVRVYKDSQPYMKYFFSSDGDLLHSSKYFYGP